MKLNGLLKHRKIVYSQYGEEGILQFLINNMGIEYIECCEFGMNGSTYSNTLYFIENFDSYGVYIDQYIENIRHIKYDNVYTICKKIELNGKNSLDNLLFNTKLSTNFDILSIDVDNEDYHIWNSLKNYKPKIVIIEFNPFIPPNKEYVYNGSKFSSSFLSTIKLGKRKGYKLVCMTGNLIFVREDLLINSTLEYLLHIKDNDLFLGDAIIDPRNNRSYTFKRYLDEIPKTSLI
jgi:hypothetical protein